MTSAVNSFKFEKVYHFNSSIYSLKIANKNVIAVTKNILLRYTIGDVSSFEEIKIPCENDLAQSIFLDPTGNHALICMQTKQSFYLHKTSKKFRVIKEANGLLIESVGWNNRYSSETSTGVILLGTESGELIETKFMNTQTNFEQYWKIIHRLEQSINGIIFDSYPDSNNLKYFLIFTTATNLYHIFCDLSSVSKGSSLFAAEFEKINQGVVGLKCFTFPKQFGYSCLDLFYPNNGAFPNHVAWMNGVGVYSSKLHKKSTDAETNLFNEPKLLQYVTEMKSTSPITMAASAFHVIVQYSGIIYFTCIINEETVFSYSIDKLVKEKAVGLCKDSSTGFIYLFTNSYLYRINCDEETNNLWRMFVNLKNYELAYEYCNNDKERNSVRIKEAENLYKDQRYMDAAVLYAGAETLFEETVLLFIDLDSKEPLKRYLLSLNTKSNPVNPSLKNTYDVITMWLLELFFEDIISHNFKSGVEITNESLKVIDPGYKQYVEHPDIINSLKRNKSIIYEKIKIYGDCMQAAIFAEIIQDREKIMENLIEKGNFQEALQMLTVERSASIHYRYGAKLIVALPAEVIDLWITLAQKLDPKKVLPIIRNIPDRIAKKYVKYVIKKLETEYEEIHNYYVLICARLECANNSEGGSGHRDLIEYLEQEGTNIHHTKYDSNLALRICMEYGHIEGSVFLHCLLNKHREAVELALKENNVELAKKVASTFYGPEEIKKHLWLQIARFIISVEADVHAACRLVKNQHTLMLEDILPYFPDYVKIEQFSEAICDSLGYYETHMNNLKIDMKMSRDYANKNREEINLLKQKPLIIPEKASCAFCKDLLTTRVFCAFSCSHSFHLQCLEQVVEPMLSNENKIKLYSLKERLLQTTYDDVDLKREYESLLTTDCGYCGTLAIDNVDVPLLRAQEFEAEMGLWL